MKKLKLTQNKFALVDDEDFEFLNQMKWFFNLKNKQSSGYAQRNKYLGSKKYKTVYMHREIMKARDGQEVDHINGNSLDNRKSNLRLVSHAINMRNRKSVPNTTSIYVGVHLHKLTQKWRAQIKINNKVVSLGLFKTQELAREARDQFIEENKLIGFRR